MKKDTINFYCEICGWKRQDDSSLIAIPTSPIVLGIPKIDEKTNKLVIPKERNQPKKIKCPICGRLVTSRKVLK